MRMSGRKGKAVAQRSNSNRMKHDNTPSSHSTAAKPNVEPTISTSTEDTKQFLVPQDRTGLTLNSLSYLSQDALLFSCFNLTLLHFYCQMYLLYRQVTNIVFSGCNAHPLTRETLRTLVALPPPPTGVSILELATSLAICGRLAQCVRSDIPRQEEGVSLRKLRDPLSDHPSPAPHAHHHRCLSTSYRPCSRPYGKPNTVYRQFRRVSGPLWSPTKSISSSPPRWS